MLHFSTACRDDVVSMEIIISTLKTEMGGAAAAALALRALSELHCTVCACARARGSANDVILLHNQPF